MADQTLEIQIKVAAEVSKIKETTTELVNLKKESNKTQKEISSLFGDIAKSYSEIPKNIIGTATALLSLGKVISVLKESVHEAIAANEIYSRLSFTLDGTTEEVNSQVKALREFAGQIQETTKFSDNLVLSQIVVAKNFGLTTEESKKLIKAATELSTVWGKDLQTSTEALLKSLSGNLPREIGVLGREFRNLTIEQLKSGAAIELVNSKFGGKAEKDIKTYSGALAQLANTASSAKQTIGELILETGILQNAISKTNSALKRVFGFETETEKLERFRKELQITGDAARKFILEKQIKEIEIKIKNDQFKQALSDIDEAIKQSKNRELSLQIVVDQGAKQKFLDDIKKIGLTTTQTIQQERDERLKELKKVFGDESSFNRLSVEDRKDAVDAKLRIEKDFNLKLAKERKEELSRVRADIRARQEIFKRAQEDIFKGILEFSKTGDKNILAGIVSGLGKAVTQGREGASSLLGGAAAFGAAKFGGPLGEVVGPAVGDLVKELSKGKEAARAFVTEFLDSIPEMIAGLVEGIVAAAETFAEKVPVVIDKLISETPRIIDALVAQAPSIGAELAVQMPTVAQTFAISLIEQAPNIAQAIVKAIANTPGNAAKSVGRLLRFAEGGQAFVKSVTGGVPGQDSVPAALMPGELVVSQKTTRRFEKFLEQQENQTTQEQKNNNQDIISALLSQPIIVKINEREIARATRNQVRGGMVLA